MKDFQDKVAVITGGASGIGFATAQALAKLGARLVLADIEHSVLKSAMNELSSAGAKAIGVRTDVGDRSSAQPSPKGPGANLAGSISFSTTPAWRCSARRRP
jgi:NAD(P)-dependent dehydrogenase (short-subunit alcohol dehydrogenase family)